MDHILPVGQSLPPHSTVFVLPLSSSVPLPRNRHIFACAFAYCRKIKWQILSGVCHFAVCTDQSSQAQYWLARQEIERWPFSGKVLADVSLGLPFQCLLPHDAIWRFVLRQQTEILLLCSVISCVWLSPKLQLQNKKQPAEHWAHSVWSGMLGTAASEIGNHFFCLFFVCSHSLVHACTDVVYIYIQTQVMHDLHSHHDPHGNDHDPITFKKKKVARSLRRLVEQSNLEITDTQGTVPKCP